MHLGELSLGRRSTRRTGREHAERHLEVPG